MLSDTQRIVRAIIWSLSGILPGWFVGRWIGILNFGGYYGRIGTMFGSEEIVYPGIAAIIGAFLGWFLGTLLNAWPKTRSTRFQCGCWIAMMLIGMLLAIFCPVIPARE
jgi:hypothetical protein